jgi:hypothetical protein
MVQAVEDFAGHKSVSFDDVNVLRSHLGMQPLASDSPENSNINTDAVDAPGSDAIGTKRRKRSTRDLSPEPSIDNDADNAILPPAKRTRSQRKPIPSKETVVMKSPEPNETSEKTSLEPSALQVQTRNWWAIKDAIKTALAELSIKDRKALLLNILDHNDIVVDQDEHEASLIDDVVDLFCFGVFHPKYIRL